MNTLICDLDMTLVDSRRDIAIALARALSDITGKEYTESRVTPLIGQGLPALFARFAPHIALGSELFWKGVKIYQTFFKEHCNIHTTVYPGVIDTLKSLQDREIRLAIASNKWGSMARHVCEKNGLDHFFSHFQGTEETPGKPKPDVIIKCCRAISADPRKSVYVGDRGIDIQAGRAAGCFTAAVTYGLDSKEDLKRESPDLLIDRFDRILERFD
jgi:HAD superfamily hydrolase (TIGR01549 family)